MTLFSNINPSHKSKRVLDKIHPNTNNRAEGFVHPPEQEKETEAMALTLPVKSSQKEISPWIENREYLARCNSFKIIRKCLDLIFRP
jgi:hypothetical protein